MKKVILLLSALALFQHWDTVQRWLQPPLANRPGEVVLYATQWCGYCAKTREQLAQDQIAYREIDIEKDPAGTWVVKARNKVDERGFARTAVARKRNNLPEFDFQINVFKGLFFRLIGKTDIPKFD